MPGFYGFFSTKKDIRNQKIYRHFYSYKFVDNINEEHKSGNFIFGRSVIPKFLEDRILFEDDDIIICIEGIITNIKKGELLNLLKGIVGTLDHNFIKNLEGTFSGFIYKKGTKKLILFTDSLASKPLYYYINKSEGVFFFASELKVLSKTLRENNYSLSINNDGIRCLLTFGYMLDDITPINEIKKQSNGTLLYLDLNSFQLNKSKYFDFKRLKAHKSTLKDLTDEVDSLLVSSIKSQWKKDEEYGYEHFAFLSGGLDSRVNVMLAYELGYTKVNLLTFSEPGTLDEKIAKKIARNLQLEHEFISLNKGKYLEKNLEEYISQNDGLVILYGAAHMVSALEKIELSNFGFSHSGQIGDVLFGSFYRHGNISENIKKLCYSRNHKLLEKIQTWVRMKECDFDGDDLEIFTYKHRVVNGVLNGDRSISSLIDNISPFYNQDLLRFCTNLPGDLKSNAWFYKDWMAKKHPELQKYKWQASGTYPKNGQFINSIYFLNRVLRYGRRIIGFEKENMNPFQNWYNQNLFIRNTIQDLFAENLQLVEDEELRNDIINEFNSEFVTEKLNALSALLSIKLHFSV